MSKKVMLLLFKKSNERDELEELCEGFTDTELNKILDSIKLPGGDIRELMDVFLDKLRKAKNKKLQPLS